MGRADIYHLNVLVLCKTRMKEGAFKESVDLGKILIVENVLLTGANRRGF